MDVYLLGPVEVVTTDGVIAVGGPKERALLAMLALEPGSVVSTAQLIDGLWGDEPPATAPKLVQLYVSHVRKALAAGGEDAAIATHGSGYELCVGRDRVDVTRCERLLAQGAARDALALWRGAPLADVAREPFAALEIRRLEELRNAAVELAIQQDLDAGRHHEVLPELEALLAKEPLRERLHAQRLLALYRCGRQADALEAYVVARRQLVGEVGVEPGPELRRLHSAILRHDPALEVRSARERHVTPLLGREEELERLRRVWRRAREAGRASVLVTGPAGSGKTRLAQELADEVRLTADVVWIADHDAAPAHVQGPALVVCDGPAAVPATGTGVLVVITGTETETAGSVAEETIALRPLDSEAAAALVRFHAGARSDGAPSIERIVSESGGIPGRLQQAALAWARTEGLRRVADAAGRAAADRARSRLAEDDVATAVADLQELRAHTAAPAPSSAKCPYKGLVAFEVEDAPFYFGRERLVGDLVAGIAGARLLGIVGPSGSGKSSALRAGLLAALRDGVLPGSADWPQVVLRPGSQPLRALERATRSRPAGDRWVLAVDQFEELFAVCSDDGEREAFVARLIEASSTTALVVLALRADFYGRCAAYPQLARLLRGSHHLVGPMRSDELARAIELPALRAGVAADPELVAALAADVEGEPGALPLLSTALAELWHQPDGPSLTAAAYERAGGVRGAVARLAEDVYASLSRPERDQARRVLLRLAGDGDVRVRVPRADVADDDAVVAVLAERRLVTISDEGVEVAHEALLREWPRLRAWLDEDADGRRVHRHLARAAREWDAAGREASELYRGPRLAASLDWRAEHESDLNTLEREFLVAGQQAAEEGAERRRRVNRRLRTALAGVVVLLVAAVVAGVTAVGQRSQARGAALTADAQRIGAEAVVEDRLDRALLLARAGVELERSTATESRLLSVLLRQPAALGELRGDGWPLYAGAVSSDGKLVAMGDERGGVLVYDVRTREQVGRTYHFTEGTVQQVTFSPDARSLVATTYDEARKVSLVDVIDARSGRRRRRFELPRFPGPTFYVLVLAAFAPDGRDLLVTQSPVEFPDGGPPVLWRLDTETGEHSRAPERIGQAGAWNLVTTTDRRRVFVTSAADDRTYELSPRTLRIRRAYPAGAKWGAVNGRGTTFALASPDGTLRLLDLRTGAVRRLKGKHEQGEDVRLAFTPDGRTLVSADVTGEIIVWDVRTGSVRERLRTHEDAVPELSISGDGRTLVSAGRDGKLVLWDLGGDRRLVRPFAAGPPMVLDDQSPKAFALSPDGRTLAVGQGDATVRLIDTRTLASRGTLHVDALPLGLDFSPDSGTLAVTGKGASVALWDVERRQRVRLLRGPRRKTMAQSVLFSPDGRLVAAGAFRPTGLFEPSFTGSVTVWYVATGARQASYAQPASSLAFSPDSRLLAGAAFDLGTEVHDARTGRLVARPELDDFPRTVAFSPDGRTLAIGQYGGGVTTLSTATWRPAGRAFENHAGRVTALEFSADGSRLLTGSADGTLVLSDVASRRPIGTALTVEDGAYIAAGFDRDGTHVFAVPYTGRAVRWDLRPAAWDQQACMVAGRDMTAREWRDVLPTRSFRPVCS